MKKRVKKTTIILAITILTLFFITGSAIAVPVFLNPRPIPEPAIMLLFGAGLIGMSVVGRKLRKK